ncbi:hypothetical protein UNSWDHB_952 [Dehalobacter sp. UNSWDHB]|nr:hypothetical protein DHBDCA_p1599 [Dehalobacter sp. DCA]AFV05613.1 hypothetical protein DCF50_p1609 [Dehalobacter sp. CF]EQB21748.1 hypothetical protein UNSWDHB_952 [Dehalobacter sp. UNSWDHB]
MVENGRIGYAQKISSENILSKEEVIFYGADCEKPAKP